MRAWDWERVGAALDRERVRAAGDRGKVAGSERRGGDWVGAGGDPGAVGGVGAGTAGGISRRGWYEVGGARESGRISGRGFSVDVRGAWEGGVSPEKYGKVRSSNVTWREMITLRVERSRHRYPLCSRGYPRKTHRDERGESLWGLVAMVLGKQRHPKTRM